MRRPDVQGRLAALEQGLASVRAARRRCPTSAELRRELSALLGVDVGTLEDPEDLIAWIDRTFPRRPAGEAG
jgi:predicted secreted protein